MSFVLSVLVVLHLLSWAVALGLWVAAAGTRQPNKAIAHASATALVIGIVMMGLSMATGGTGHLWFALKLLFAAIAAICSVVAISRREETPSLVWFGIPTAIVLNVIVAVFRIGA
ncbi:hypothetical protein CIK81_12155 [Brachybacterium sp. JB7]|uniref:hypothetical protein n=1 Tax=Brachybacterium TaxID=43668 RepID=UPI000DF4397A|nr:hypothetical protein [Brachybacterium sp. JB7]RCS63652.1 hypothetical protein CIK81_12155 [Brachybacterium sp. JB7]